MYNLSKPLINISLRSMTLGGKFLLLFFIAGFLLPEDLGLFGLTAATITYAIFPLGFDFYSYTTREILKKERHEWGALIKNQGALHLALYLFFLPLLLLVFFTGILPWTIAAWFFAILILEHINQELMRLLVTLSQQLAASLVLFFRQGAWSIIVSILMFWKEDTRNLDTVFTAWLTGSAIALFFAIYTLLRLKIGSWHKKVDWQWILRGMKVALPFLLATLAMRAMYTFDRYWFEELQGLDVLGVYVLFIGIAHAMMSVMEAGVFSFIYPNLISAHNQADSRQFRQAMLSLFFRTTGLGAVFSVTALVLIQPLVLLLENPIYLEYLNLFPWILLAIMLHMLSMIPHYGLYAQGHDKPIIYSHIVSLVVFFPVTWLISRWHPLLAVPLGMSCAFTFIILLKIIALYRLSPNVYLKTPILGSP